MNQFVSYLTKEIFGIANISKQIYFISFEILEYCYFFEN